jgi:hypothetical protein
MDTRITVAIMTNPVVQSEVLASKAGITTDTKDIEKIAVLVVDMVAKAYRAHADIMLKTLAEQGEKPEASRILRPTLVKK